MKVTMKVADREDRCQEVDKEDAKMRKHDISMPDDAEGQRLNPSADMSKLSLGRMNYVQCVFLSRIWQR